MADLVQIVVTTRLIHSEAGAAQSSGEMPGALIDAIRLAHSEGAAESEAFEKANSQQVMLR